MLIVVIVLAVTNLASLAVLVRLMTRPSEHPRPSLSVARTLDAAPPPPDLSTSATRQIISVEILNPLELASGRGRLAGLAGTFAPGLARRVVYDQAYRQIRTSLELEQVVADVRMHTIRPGGPQPPTEPPSPA